MPPTVLEDTREVASVVVTAVHSVLSRQLLVMATQIINLQQQQQPDPKRPKQYRLQDLRAKDAMLLFDQTYNKISFYCHSEPQ